MNEFEVVLRGYDRVAVDTLAQAIEAAIEKSGPLPMTLRGYSPAQVDAWIAGAAAGTAAADTGTGVLELSVVLRGYRPAETDALLAAVGAGLGSDDDARRAEALRAITRTQLPVGFRGYDRGQVDDYLRRAKSALRKPVRNREAPGPGPRLA